jgi:pimeloyl-ACP methyl ester carboxylesterase
MNILKTRVILFLLVLLGFQVMLNAQSKRNLGFKQLAGSADEISTMKLPRPEKTGVRSKSAMLPIYNENEIDIPVDNTDNFRVMLLAPNTKGWKVNIALPNDDFVDGRNALESRGISRIVSSYGLENNQFPAEIFAFGNLEKGKMRIKFDLPENVQNSGKALGYLVVSSESNERLYSYLDTYSTVVGNEIGLVAKMFDRNFDNEIDVPSPSRVAISDAKVRIINPNGEISMFSMSGTEQGNIRGSFVPTIGGKYTAQIIVRGINADGNEILRTSEQTFDVASRQIRIGGKVQTSLVDALRWRIGLPISGIGSNQRVIVNAEVWGQNDKGEIVSTNWLGGMMYPEFVKGRTTLPLNLDSRWLAREGIIGNVELRNIRVQDADNTVVLGEANSVSLPNVFAPNNARNAGKQITEDMRVGVNPNQNTATNAPGGKLMLVHGYCSGGNTFPTSQFTNYVVFNDPNQNRTHDQFANLIKNFGASLPSFGIVAHSQGGAASLHLYTYYWSGLDYATGGTRLIQSVGTPYQGTALAGNLALLGQIFGAGCGSNTNLTYSGAASWLSGIPTWARAKVYYHTTSFTDVWWRYDYCNLATDVFLSDPEDGVVERSYAQLTGANNLGHKTGWCHTSGMRDPAQTGDSSRNSNMNTNAAR